MEPKISVIVPVYNAGKYINRCVDSILAQTFTDFELILVDDGSLDDSLIICKKYVERDNRVNVVSQTNGGPSKARNLGLKMSKGQYITFIDADDYILENYLKALVEGSADFVLSGYTNFYEEFNNEFKNIPGKNFYIDKNSVEFLKAIEYIETKGLLASPCCKLVKNNLLKDFNIQFDESLNYGEDHLFNLDIISHVSSIKVLNVANYIYTHGSRESLTNRVVPWEIFSIYIDERYEKRIHILNLYDKENVSYRSLIESEHVRYLWQLIHSLYYQEPNTIKRKKIISDIIQCHFEIIFKEVYLPVSYNILRFLYKYFTCDLADAFYRIYYLFRF